MNPGKHAKGTERPTAPEGQATLAASASTPAEDENARIDRLVSLTYDADPLVRKKATIELSRIDDPRAIFALLELSADKDQQIKELALAGLGNFKEEKEAIVDLEKIFEAKAEGKASEQDIEATKSKMMPSIEKIFSKHKASKDRLMPSIEKLFTWMNSGGSRGVVSPPRKEPEMPAQAPALAREDRIEAAHDEASVEEDGETEGETEQAPEAGASEQTAIRSASQDPLSSIERMQHRASSLEKAEARIGVLPNRANPDVLRQIRNPQEGHAEHIRPTQERLDEAINFPLPANLEQKMNSPVLSIPMLAGSEDELKEEEEKLPKSRLDYYQWAYALAITPGITSANMKKEKERLLKDIKNEIEQAFDIAIKRAKENGIESLTGLKPGMKKITTFPMEVLEHTLVMVPTGKKKMTQMARIMVSDGKRLLPLYVVPQRGSGINKGDLISLRDMYVDYFTHSSELVLLLGKNGQILLTK
ncbi:MAG: HEAT repeat domain-containing protein [Candidatus Micrarchaeota archaeon]